MTASFRFYDETARSVEFAMSGTSLSRTSLPFLICSFLFLQLCHASGYAPLMAPLASRKPETSLFSFNDTWQVLGPFQIGTRGASLIGSPKTSKRLTLFPEATWGADPLEFVGGFRQLEYDPKATFRSSLPTNGTALWNTTKAVHAQSDSISANASLSVGYSNVDWDFLKAVYGWAAVQYQVWARGEVIVGGNETQHAVLHTDAILEYWVDDKHYFGGDFYTYRKAPPVLHLRPGSHRIDIRLVRDVRAFGGILEPTIDVVVDVRQASGSLELAKPGILVSDVVDGKLASSIASVYLRNSGEDDIEIVEIRSSNVSSQISFAGLDLGAQPLVTEMTNTDNANQSTQTSSGGYNSSSVLLVAGQTRPLAFNITLPAHNSSSVEYKIVYRTVNGSHLSTLQVFQNLNHLTVYEPHKVTFLHPGGMASYAMLRPPAKNATCPSAQSKLPVLLQLHGAGLEADSAMVTSALDPVSDLCAWVLFPTGVTPWSSDDWHNWGFADVEAAIAAIPTWIQDVGWKGPGVDAGRWIVSGHSNGGQGTWYAIMHRPDKVLAAAPVSGYASIQKYVPYELWQPADPRRTAIISASLNSYRHEMLMSNAHGIPIQQQHGGIDDNVPAYHSRFLAEQLYRTGVTGTTSSYNEVEGRNHWWDTVMTTPELVDFYYSQTKNRDVLPRKMEHFSIVVGDPGDMGSKNGIRVTHLEDPGWYGRIGVKGHTITTSNVLGLEFNPALWSETVILDRQELNLAQAALIATASSVTAYKSAGGWSLKSSTKDTTHLQRNGRQLGGMTAILRSHGPFIIRHQGSANTTHIALQISRNLHQYFQADTVITKSYSLTSGASGNVITLAIGPRLDDIQPGFSIRVGASGVTVRDYRGQEQWYGEVARGAAFLRPLADERLELVLWGADDEGLRQVSRLVPMVTGVGQPDFVVLGESAKWKGIEGALAMGFFDSNWKVTPSSVIESG
jgi:poly(3-hydroxybutyrate) depolymerase